MPPITPIRKKYDIICLPPQTKAVYLVIESIGHDNDPDTKRYVYEEGTCPTNFLRGGVEMIVIDGDTDPHGLFDYVRTIDEPEFSRRDHYSDNEWRSVIPEAF